MDSEKGDWKKPNLADSWIRGKGSVTGQARLVESHELRPGVASDGLPGPTKEEPAPGSRLREGKLGQAASSGGGRSRCVPDRRVSTLRFRIPHDGQES